jgi:hypothetical protein
MKKVYHDTPPFPAENDIFPTRIVCHRCGVIDEYRHTPGKHPHHACLICTACGTFIRWMPKPQTPLKPTEKQIHFLRALGHQGELPPSRKLASERIDALLKGRVSHV